MLDVVLPFENVLDVIAMDWDPIADEMYWALTYDSEITIRKGKMSPPYFEVNQSTVCQILLIEFNSLQFEIQRSLLYNCKVCKSSTRIREHGTLNFYLFVHFYCDFLLLKAANG